VADLLARYVERAMTWESWDQPIATFVAACLLVLGVCVAIGTSRD